MGRAREGIDEGIRAHELDPLSPIISYALGEAYRADRQFDKAIEVNEKASADNPTFLVTHEGLGYIYWQQHKYADAIREFRLWTQGDEEWTAWSSALDEGFRSGGWPAAQRKAIDALIAHQKIRIDYSAPFFIAQGYADIGDKNHAFQWLNTAYEQHNTLLYQLPGDFTFDSLRSDPRYVELVRKIGFPK